LLVAGPLFVVLLVLAATVPVPYVILSPGPTYNTLGSYQDNGAQQDIIVINGRDTNTVTGNLNMTTVSVTTGHITAAQALVGWLKGDETVVPRASVYPPGQSEAQVNAQNTQAFAESQDSATAAALCELGYPNGFGVVRVDPTLGANGVLRPGDMIVSIDGASADSADKLSALLTKATPGQVVTVGVTRDGQAQSLSIKLSPPAAGATGARLGITVTTGCLAPFEVDLGLGDQIGGPSAGLMFALGIMDKVGPTDITGGRFIAGTGEITADGKVLPIGGIQLKMIAARRAGATVFLAPQANCSDVRGAIPRGLDVISVATLHDAVTDLANLRAGAPVPHC